MTGSLLDDLLDRTVLIGYTSIGYRIRSHGWSASELRPMNGKVVLITGASSGLGLAAAEGFARLGATVWLVVRSRERGEHARTRIAERSGNDDVHVALCDLSNLESLPALTGGVASLRSRVVMPAPNPATLTLKAPIRSNARFARSQAPEPPSIRSRASLNRLSTRPALPAAGCQPPPRTRCTGAARDTSRRAAHAVAAGGDRPTGTTL